MVKEKYLAAKEIEATPFRRQQMLHLDKDNVMNLHIFGIGDYENKIHKMM